MGTVNSDKKPRYLTQAQPGFVYGLDEQSPNKVFCILVEGQVDAIHVDGCAIGGSEINDQQALLLNRLQKQIIVVPDRDKSGSKLVEQAIDYGWSVSMPEWSQDIIDVGDAVSKYGRLYALHSIVSASEDSALKILIFAACLSTEKFFPIVPPASFIFGPGVWGNGLNCKTLRELNANFQSFSFK